MIDSRGAGWAGRPGAGGIRCAGLRWLSLGLCIAWLGAGWGAPRGMAEDGKVADPAPAADVPQKPNATEALRTLFESAQKRLRKPKDKVAVTKEVMDELAAFAESYPDTEESGVALFNHGLLAGMSGDEKTAEASFRKAMPLASDPQLRASIAFELAQILVQPGRPILPFKVTTTDGREVTPEAYRGKILLLDFWATWCGPCLMEMPNVRKLYDKYHEKGLEILGVNLDDTEEALRDYLKEEKLPWAQVFNRSQPKETNIQFQFGAFKIPHMVLADREGKVIGVGLRGEELADAMKKAASEGPKDKAP